MFEDDAHIELAASPAGSRPELPNLRVVELAFVACAQAMRRACRPGLRGRRQRRESLGMAQKKAGQAHGRLVARARFFIELPVEVRALEAHSHVEQISNRRETFRSPFREGWKKCETIRICETTSVDFFREPQALAL